MIYRISHVNPKSANTWFKQVVVSSALFNLYLLGLNDHGTIGMATFYPSGLNFWYMAIHITNYMNYSFKHVKFKISNKV
jgi:hypothetical protein